MSVNLGGKIVDPFRQMMASDKRSMSQGHLIETMRKQVESSGVLKGQAGRILAVRAATGTHLGVSEKQQLKFMGEANKAKLLGVKYHESPHLAVSAYDKNVKSYAEQTAEKKAHKSDVGHDTKEEKDEETREAEHEKKIHDNIEASKKASHENEEETTVHYGASAVKSSTTSIHHVVDEHKSGHGDDAEPSHIPMQLD